MKNLVRVLTLALTATGMAAAFQATSTQNPSITAKISAANHAVGRVVPSCGPNDPNACHIDGK